MAFINLNTVTVPTPQPFDKTLPTQNQENFCFVMLQIFGQLKAASFKIADKDELETALILALQDLIYNGETLDLGPIQVMRTGKTFSVSGP